MAEPTTMATHSATLTAVSAVMVERQRQREKRGDPILSLAAQLAILVQEVGDVARVISEPWNSREPATLEIDRDVYRRELVQVAAVAVAAIEAVDW